MVKDAPDNPAVVRRAGKWPKAVFTTKRGITAEEYAVIDLASRFA
ncbi:MAG TPA: hypothetical protein VMH30_11905 [Verrucomicrobiae bacterium]|nr:hypothetical protein [Verrucomicrobiae bacterium]